jgi:uncharacterized protein DUF4349
MSGSTLRWIRRVGIGAAALLVAGFAVGSLAGSSSKEDSGHNGTARSALTARSVAKGAPVSAPGSAGVIDASTYAVQAAGTSERGAPANPSPSDSVIKTAELAVEVVGDDVDRATTRAFAIASRYGGFVLSSSSERSSGSGASRSGEIVIRVRADKFDAALADLSNRDFGKVVRRSTSGQDVSQEFVDLNARLRNAKAQESILLSLMSKSKTVGDTIAVQQQLSQVQQQIEELTGRIRYLKDQTDLATISVQLGSKGSFGGGSFDEPSFAKAWRTALDGLERMGTAALIGGIWLGPFALLAAVVLATRRWRARPVPQV